MAHLIGVQHINDALVYKGVVYTKVTSPPRVGDIVLAREDYSDVDFDDYFLVTETRGGVVAFEDDGGDLRGFDDEADVYDLGVVSSDFHVFRKQREDLRTYIENKAQELAELNRLSDSIDEKERIRVGDYVLLNEPSYNRKINAGAIAFVSKVDPLDAEVPYRLTTIFGGRDWAVASSVKKITQDEARKLLHERVDEALGA